MWLQEDVAAIVIRQGTLWYDAGAATRMIGRRARFRVNRRDRRR